ncbi:MAG: OsmC family protein [Bernardetiaceae bacterium]|jgi:putative redox protein|nr:OsmC family protein [Bernardetiaceae bacterium]
MQIVIDRLDDAYHLEARTETGHAHRFDASADIGGRDLAMRPMQAVLAALGACTEIDVISILQKQRAGLRNLRLTLTGQRAEGQIPAVFTAIHIHYEFWGQLQSEQAERAIRLSLEKYCSVTAMLSKTATITHSYAVVGE